jgi:hypothetical protein
MGHLLEFVVCLDLSEGFKAYEWQGHIYEDLPLLRIEYHVGTLNVFLIFRNSVAIYVSLFA